MRRRFQFAAAVVLLLGLAVGAGIYFGAEDDDPVGASYIIAGGTVAASGSFVELKDHDSEIVHQFINGLADGPVAFHYPAPDYYEDLLAG